MTNRLIYHKGWVSILFFNRNIKERIGDDVMNVILNEKRFKKKKNWRELGAYFVEQRNYRHLVEQQNVRLVELVPAV